MLKISDIPIEKLKTSQLKEQLPEFYALRKCVENFHPWHTNESVYDHTLSALGELEEIFQVQNKNLQSYLFSLVNRCSKKDLLYLATVLHDIGKPETLIKVGEETRCPNHEIFSAIKSEGILKRFDISPNEKKRILKIIRSHGFFCVSSHKNPERTYQSLRKDYENIFLDMLLLELADTRALHISEERGKKQQQWMTEFYQKQINEFLRI